MITQIQPSKRQLERFQKAMGINSNYGFEEKEEPCLRCVLDGEKIDCKGIKIEELK